jgi:hypothetical protein
MVASTPPTIWLALAALCLAAGGIGLCEATGDAPTIDEPVYVSAGVASLERHDLRLNPQHPPLAKALAAIPVLLARPWLPGGRAWERHHERSYARVFLMEARHRRQLRELTLLSRIVPLLELMASGLLVFVLARRLGGPPAGLLAAALWLLNPLTLGIGHVDGIDLPFAVAMLATVLALVRWLDRPTTRRLVVVSVSCAAAILTRDSGPLVLLAAVGAVWWRVGSPRHIAVLAAVALSGVWAIYLALDPAYTVAHLNVLPQRYLDGLRLLRSDHSRSAPAFLLGKLWYGGRWWFWPGSMLVKLPATLLLSMAGGLVALRRVPRDRRTHLLIAAVPLGALQLLFTVFSPVDFGLRYLLGVIALLCVGCGALMLQGRRVVPVALAVATAAFGISSIPHSIAWVAPPFGPSYTAGAAANGDWGQDAWRLQAWARGRHAWIACYTPAGTGCAAVPGAHRLHRLTPRSAVHGSVAISASLINLHGWDPWVRRLRPVGNIGGTELLYRVR